jgi:ABC-type Fe3+-hydroxamate transport system substrate-binding protein
MVAQQLAKMPVVILPAGFRFQPVEAGEVAARLAELALGTPAGLVPDIGGPKIYTAADDSFLAELITLAGGDPITTGSTTNFEIPLEKLVTADPELILLGDAAYGTTADAVKARNGWAAMTAVKSGAIVPVDDVLVSRPGPRLVDGLRALALAIHPDAAIPAPGGSGAPGVPAGSGAPDASAAVAP